jgi:hypothetical protein
VSTRKPVAAVGGGALVALALVLTPAIASQGDRAKAPSISPRANGGFTPAVSDPRLAAALARRGATSSGEMRLTPATSATSRDRSVRVAIRARASGPEAGRAAAWCGRTTRWSSRMAPLRSPIRRSA